MKRDLALKQQERHLQLAESGRGGASFESPWDILKILHETTIELAQAQNDGATVIASYQALIETAQDFAEKSKIWIQARRSSEDDLIQWQIHALDYQIKLEQAPERYK